MRNLRYLAIFAGLILLAGIAALVLAANPHIALLGKLAIAVAVIGFAAGAMSYLAQQSLAALALRNEDFHWH